MRVQRHLVYLLDALFLNERQIDRDEIRSFVFLEKLEQIIFLLISNGKSIAHGGSNSSNLG